MHCIMHMHTRTYTCILIHIPIHHGYKKIRKHRITPHTCVAHIQKYIHTYSIHTYIPCKCTFHDPESCPEKTRHRMNFHLQMPACLDHADVHRNTRLHIWWVTTSMTQNTTHTHTHTHITSKRVLFWSWRWSKQNLFFQWRQSKHRWCRFSNSMAEIAMLLGCSGCVCMHRNLKCGKRVTCRLWQTTGLLCLASCHSSSLPRISLHHSATSTSKCEHSQPNAQS
jgi:hypothetical protein